MTVRKFLAAGWALRPGCVPAGGTGGKAGRQGLGGASRDHREADERKGAEAPRGEAHAKSWKRPIASGSTKTSPTSSPTKSARPSSGSRPTTNAISSSNSSGCAATPPPTPIENEYKEEHYRRIAYANERFASGIPGWKTDRGRIYITYGPPDERDEHPSGGTYERPMEEGGGTTSTYPVRDTGATATSRTSAPTSTSSSSIRP